MTRKQLEFFLKTAEVLNISKAAKELYISQPSLSEQIHKLEKDLGVQLFIRSNRSLTLTVPGKVLVKEVQELFAKEQELRDAVSLAGEISQRVLRIRFLAGPFSEIIPEILQNFSKRYPQYKVELYDESWNTITEDMSTLKYDIAFYLRIADRDFAHTQHLDLMENQCFYMMSKTNPLATRESLDFKDIENEIFCIDIKPERDNAKYSSLHEIFEHHGKKPNTLYAKNMASSITIIRSSMAIGVGSPAFLKNQTNGLVFVPSDELPIAALSIYWHEKNDNPGIKDFISVAKETMVKGTLLTIER